MTVASRSVGVGVGLVLTALLFALLVWSVGTGEIAIPPGEVLATLFGGGDRATSFVIETLRLPRSLTGALIGIALGASGAIFQSVTRNPLGSPDIVGFLQGAAAAAVLQIVVFGGGTSRSPAARSPAASPPRCSSTCSRRAAACRATGSC